MKTEMVYLPTFFKLSSFVFRRTKKVIKVWKDMSK